MMRFAGLFGMFFLMLSSGCASVYMRASFHHIGEADPTIDQRVKDEYEAQYTQPYQGQENIKVLVNSIPEGLSWSDGLISNKEGYQHQILGSFSLGASWGAFPDYKQSWRKYVCYWQEPLVWVTLAVWYLVPTYYPCYTTSMRPKEEIIAEVKRLTGIAGGDLAVIQYGGVDPEEPSLASSAGGFIIKLDPRLKREGYKTIQQKMDPAIHGI